MNAIQALSQLSYTPVSKVYLSRSRKKSQGFFSPNLREKPPALQRPPSPPVGSADGGRTHRPETLKKEPVPGSFFSYASLTDTIPGIFDSCSVNS